MRNLFRRLRDAFYDNWQRLIFWLRDKGISDLFQRFVQAFADYLRQIIVHLDTARSFPKYRQLRFLLQTYATVAFLIFPLIYLGTGIQDSDPECLLDRVGQAVYFSFITITTTGYGDISPDGFLPRLIACIEVACGLLIIAFAIPALTSNE